MVVMALLNRKLGKGMEYPRQICFLDDTALDESERINMEQLGLPVVGPETNNNEQPFVPLSHTIYVLNNFENNPILSILEKTPNVMVLGITALAEFVLNPSLEFRTKPLFCTSMNGMCFHIDNQSLNLSTKERMVTLIKWMGGVFCRSPNVRTTHMIARSTLSEDYIYCSTFNVPVVMPEWVEECWKNRELAGNQAGWSETEFLVKPFQGLHICLKEFKNSQEMIPAIEENGGTTVYMEDVECTHLVLSDALIKHVNIEDIPSHIVYVVSEKWLIDSVEHKTRIYEGRYSYYKPAALLKTRLYNKNKTADSEDNEETSDSDGIAAQAVDHFSENETKVKKKMETKRKFIYNEMCETEKNYLRDLRFLVELKHHSTKSSSEKTPMLSQMESKIIFMNLELILETHEKIYKRLADGLKGWHEKTPETNLKELEIFINLKKELLKEYVIYSDSYEERLNTFRQCIKDKDEFKTLTNDMGKKIKEAYEGLFIRPIQRLPRISLLLKEISKTSSDNESDKHLALQVLETINGILRMMNDTKAATKEQEQIFDLYYQIEDCPAEIISHRRKLVDQIHVSEITDKSQSKGAQLILFLFNDVIEVVKLKSKKPETHKKLNKAEKSSSQKPLKHVKLIELSTITHVLTFENNGEGDAKIFGFNLKDKETSEKKIYCFLYLEDENSFDIKMQSISRGLYMNSHTWGAKTMEHYLLRDVPLKRLIIDPINKPNYKTESSDIKRIATKAFKSISKKTLKTKHRRSSSCSKAFGMSFAL